MFVWGVLKHGVLISVWFLIGDLPMYIFFISTHPYSITELTTVRYILKLILVFVLEVTLNTLWLPAK